MKSPALLSLLAFTLVLAVTGLAQDKKADIKEKAMPAQEAMMKAWMEAATPSAPHKLLEESTGRWTTLSKMWLAPDQPPTESKGTAEFSMILGGRFLQQKSTGEMMGQPFHGIGTMGYDNFKKKYVMTWIDDTGTAVYTAEGTADKSGKVITMNGSMDDPVTGERNKKVKYITRILDKDTQVFEMYDMGTIGDLNYKAAEITYSRVR